MQNAVGEGFTRQVSDWTPLTASHKRKWGRPLSHGAPPTACNDDRRNKVYPGSGGLQKQASIGPTGLPRFTVLWTLGITDSTSGRHSGMNAQPRQDPAIQHDPPHNDPDEYPEIRTEHDRFSSLGGPALQNPVPQTLLREFPNSPIAMHGSLSQGFTSTVRWWSRSIPESSFL